MSFNIDILLTSLISDFVHYESDDEFVMAGFYTEKIYASNIIILSRNGYLDLLNLYLRLYPIKSLYSGHFREIGEEGTVPSIRIVLDNAKNRKIAEYEILAGAINRRNFPLIKYFFGEKGLRITTEMIGEIKEAGDLSILFYARMMMKNQIEKENRPSSEPDDQIVFRLYPIN